MLVVKKSLNSSVLLVKDKKNQEFILMGKGIGYGRKSGEIIEDDNESQLFMQVDNQIAQRLMGMINSIPAKYFEVSQEIIDYAAVKLNTTFKNNIYLLLTDHISFAVDRFNSNTTVLNRVYWEIKNFYPREFEVGVYALKLLNNECNVKLPKEEAANIAFHLVNAQDEKNHNHDAIRAAKLISVVVSLVKYTTNRDFNKAHIHYSRFISHMQFFADRFFANKLINCNDNFLYEQMLKKHPFSIKCANKINDYIIKNYERNLPKEEIAYLAVHIQRLLSVDKYD